MTAAFNNRTIFNYSIRRRLFDSGFKRRPVSKNITIGPFNPEGRLPFCSLKINWSIENECAKIIFSDEAKIEVGADKKNICMEEEDERLHPYCVGVVPNKEET